MSESTVFEQIVKGSPALPILGVLTQHGILSSQQVQEAITSAFACDALGQPGEPGLVFKFRGQPYLADFEPAMGMSPHGGIALSPAQAEHNCRLALGLMFARKARPLDAEELPKLGRLAAMFSTN
jgi:hypothetical protein